MFDAKLSSAKLSWCQKSGCQIVLFLTLGAKLSGAKLSGAKLSYNPPPFLPNETILSLYLDGNESVFSSNLEAVFRLELNAINAFFTSREDCS